MCGIVSGFPLQCFKEFVRLTYSSDPDQTNVMSHADIALALLLNGSESHLTAFSMSVKKVPIFSGKADNLN